MDLKRDIGLAICKRRKSIEMTQEYLGLRIGLDQGYVSRIESGQVNLTLETIEEICKVLGVEGQDLFAPRD